MLQKSSAPRAILALVAQGIAALCYVSIFVETAARAEQPFMTLDEERSGAWWVVAQFHPFTTEVRGIPVNTIRKSWCKATELRKDLLPRDVMIDEKGGDAMEGFSFALEGNFDGSANKQVALVGVYEECSGKTGHFFLILDQPAVGKPKVRFLNTVQDAHPFAALSMDDGRTISIWACMDCDNVSKLKWDRNRRKFIWLPNPAGLD
jgi:hypothetical protein